VLFGGTCFWPALFSERAFFFVALLREPSSRPFYFQLVTFLDGAVENAFSLLKRGVYGTFLHKTLRTLLQRVFVSVQQARYANEDV
jgi:hypothetical protein